MYKEIFEKIAKNFSLINGILTEEKYNKYLGKKVSMVEIYEQIQKSYHASAITSDFENLYSSFYMLNRFVTADFKKEYFQIIKNASSGKTFTHDDVADRLKAYKNTRGKCCYQLSFISKLLHTIDDSFPIYDKNIRKVLHLSTVKGSVYEDKVANGKQILKKIGNIYDGFSVDSDIHSIIDSFDCLSEISFAKRCDFLLWAYYYIIYII